RCEMTPMTSHGKITEEMLTAYVMGELEGDARRQVEAAIAADESLRKEAEALRGFCAGLWREMQAEPAPEASPVLKENLARAMRDGAGRNRAGGPRKPSRRFVWAWVALPVAALLSVMLLTRSFTSDPFGLVETDGERAQWNVAEESRF